MSAIFNAFADSPGVFIGTITRAMRIFPPRGLAAVYRVLKKLMTMECACTIPLSPFATALEEVMKCARRGGAEIVANGVADDLGAFVRECLACEHVTSHIDQLIVGITDCAGALLPCNHPAAHEFLAFLHALLLQDRERFRAHALDFFLDFIRERAVEVTEEEIAVVLNWTGTFYEEKVPTRERCHCHWLVAALVTRAPEFVGERLPMLLEEWEANVGARTALAFCFMSIAANSEPEDWPWDENKLCEFVEYVLWTEKQDIKVVLPVLDALVRGSMDRLPEFAFRAVVVIFRMLLMLTWDSPVEGIPSIKRISDALFQELVETGKMVLQADEDALNRFAAEWQSEPRKWARIARMLGL
jgi:hypothetical protein